MAASLFKSLTTRAGYYWLVLAAVLLAVGLYSYATSTGLAGTFDSYHYLYAAQTLRQKGQLLMFDGSLYRAWPPLFAVVLSVVGAPEPVRWLNGLALIGTLLAWSAVGWQLLPASRARALPLLLALGTPLLVVSKFIWSEPIFNLLWGSYLLALLGWLRHGGWRLGLLAAGLGCLLPLQRIAGLFLLAGVGAGLAWPGTNQLVRPGRWAQLGHLVGAASGLLLWQIHRWFDFAPSASPQALASVGQGQRLMHSLADYGFVLGRWLVPLPVPSLAAVPVAGWLAVLALVLLALWPRPLASKDTAPTAADWPRVGLRMLFMGLLITVGLLAAITMRQRIGHGLHEAERYLTPLYPPVLLLVLRAWPADVRWSARIGPGLLAAWLLYQGVRMGHNVQQLRQLPPFDMAGYSRLHPAQ